MKRDFKMDLPSLKFIKNVAKKSGILLTDLLKGKFSVYFKGRADMVTDIDRGVQEFIFNEIRKKYPDHKILAEESDNDFKIGVKDCLWIIDPVDGTTNLVHSYPFFCISIAFSIGKNVLMGAVYDPLRDELFYAKKGKGAYLNGKKIGVSNIGRIENSIIATGFSYKMRGGNKKLNSYISLFKKMIIETQGLRRDGAAALDFCYTACGRVDGFYEEGLKAWDVAAGILIVQEAGGKVTDFYGKKASIFSSSFVASNRKIHKNMINLTSKF